jgi:hypothetical protein
VADRRPEIGGTGSPAAKVEVHAAGVVVCPPVPVRDHLRWRCVPTVDLPLGRVVVTATQRISSGAASSPATVQFTVVPPPPVITQPADGARSTERRPVIAGRGRSAGAPVAVFDGRRVVCETRPDRTSKWRCRPGHPLRLGWHRLVARQFVSGVDSAPSPVVRVHIVRSPGPPSSPSPRPTSPPSHRPPAVPPVAPPVLAPPTTPAPSHPARPTHPAPPAAPPRPGPTPPARSGSPPGLGPPLALQLLTTAPSLRPGGVDAIELEVGPNRATSPLTAEIEGTLGAGLTYRAVAAAKEPCVSAMTTFRCHITLAPGGGATVSIRLVANRGGPSRVVHQQLTVATTGAPVNALTVAIPVGAPRTDGLAAEITSTPGPVVVLLALFLYALAAREAERRSHEH